MLITNNHVNYQQAGSLLLPIPRTAGDEISGENVSHEPKYNWLIPVIGQADWLIETKKGNKSKVVLRNPEKNFNRMK